MKIWANEIEEGTNIWYQSGYSFKNATVIGKDNTFKMPALKLDNGELLFVNTYVYTDRTDITNEVVDEVIESCELLIDSYLTEILNLSNKITYAREKIHKLKQMKS